MHPPASISSIKTLVDDVARIIALGAGDAQTVMVVGQIIKTWTLRFDQTNLPRHLKCLIESFTAAAQRGESQQPQDIERSILSLRANLSYYAPRLTTWS